MERTASCGNRGDDVRSDCHVRIELTESGGIAIDLQSKVGRLFGSQIRSLVAEIMEFHEIRNARVEILDAGALPFVMAARMEAAIGELLPGTAPWLPGMRESNSVPSRRERRRFSRLYLPGNTPKLMINAGLHQPDGLILDLEDAVAPAKKTEARFLVRNALRALDFKGAERMVRINQVPMGLEDLEFVVPHGVNLVLVPKCESAEDLVLVEEKIRSLKEENGITTDIWLMPIIESALGVLKAYEIATSAKSVVAMAIGLEDYTADIGTRRSVTGTESFLARSMVVNACRAAGIQPIDSVYSDVGNMEGLRENVLQSKALGFDGMGCIHPRQITVIHQAFAPDDAEINKAKRIVNAFEAASARGEGVVSLGSKMIDAPVVKRALRTIDVAISAGKLNENWRKQEDEKD